MTVGQKFDCGEHGMLGARVIAKLARVSTTCIYRRIDSGVTGATLLAHSLVENRGRKFRAMTDLDRPPLIEFAITVALRFGREVPHYTWFMKEHGMSRAQSFRWVRAYRDALKLP